MSDDSDFQYSEDDGLDDSKHEKLVESVLKLNKAQHLKKPSRTEPTLKISEFNLVKSVTGKKGSIQLDDLTKALKTRKKHVEISKKLESTKKKSHILPKPLEKPQAERIRRSVGYEKNRFLFDRWEAFVTSNRAQAHHVFPLDSLEKVNVEVKNAKNLPQTWTFKSELQKELEKLEPKVEEYHIEEGNEINEFPLTLNELKEKRKEAAKLRAHQSFKEAKARRQNKIKSKKFHRILRKEKIKQKLKEFEELQKTNPEEALKKLEEIEKARALERFSLRHKSTGQWAKSKQIRAKYDKESRQVLAQQLAISRDLTQKLKNLDDDSDEDIETKETSVLDVKNTENPWTNGIKANQEVSEFVSGYKKFWSEHNHLHNSNKMEGSNELKMNTGKNVDIIDSNLELEKHVIDKTNDKIKGKMGKAKTMKNKEIKPPPKQNNKNNKKKAEETMKPKAKKSCLNNSSGEWDIDDIFEKAEKEIEQKIKNISNVHESLTKKSNELKKKSKPKKGNKTKKIDLSMPSQSKKQIIDEEMNENLINNEEENIDRDTNIEKLKQILGNDNATYNKAPVSQKKSEDIDPDKFMQPKVTDLDSALPDLMVDDGDNEGNNQKQIIMEAFEDDDIVQDFSKEKQDEIDKDKPKDIDLNLPGWGSWAGSGINPKKQRKRRRFIVRMPEVLPRRDDNKGSLIINEKAASKIKPHLVSELPFPFKRVKDYEASIRAPIGSTFVPEVAFRRFIKPSVETKMGTIIEPVTVGTLMGKNKE